MVVGVEEVVEGAGEAHESTLGAEAWPPPWPFVALCRCTRRSSPCALQSPQEARLRRG
jgi:hypothetical protein